MMGLSYELEPIFRKLETHFGEKIIFKNVMSVLVKNVLDFVNPADLSVSMEFALEKYLVKLAKIYEDEEKISGMPILMKKCKIFSAKNLSSLPLNLAYKTAQIIDAEKFKKVFENDAAKALEVDLKFCEKLFIRTLPTFLIEFDGEAQIFTGLLSYENFAEIIAEMTQKKILPEKVEATQENLEKLLRRHQKISTLEIKFAFDLESLSDAEKFIEPLAEKNLITQTKVKKIYFIEKK